MASLTFKTSINCGSCVKAVTPALNEEKNIQQWEVDTNNPDKLLTVTGDAIAAQQIISLLSDAGFSASLVNE